MRGVHQQQRTAVLRADEDAQQFFVKHDYWLADADEDARVLARLHRNARRDRRGAWRSARPPPGPGPQGPCWQRPPCLQPANSRSAMPSPPPPGGTLTVMPLYCWAPAISVRPATVTRLYRLVSAPRYQALRD